MRSSPAEDRIAVELFTRCQRTGRAVSLGEAEQLLAELDAHAPGCGCGLCSDAGRVRPQGVWAVAMAWQAGIAATRRRAAR